MGPPHELSRVRARDSVQRPMASSRRSRSMPARAAPASSLLVFAAAMARGNSRAARRALAASRREGVPRVEAQETARMLVLHAGYPAALEALRHLNETWPGAPRARREPSRATWRGRGERLCRRIYGASYPRLIGNVRRLHPALAV